MKRLLFCKTCSDYTMKELHDCGNKSVVCGPAKWSQDDKYGKYRLDARREELKNKGLI